MNFCVMSDLLNEYFRASSQISVEKCWFEDCHQIVPIFSYFCFHHPVIALGRWIDRPRKPTVVDYANAAWFLETWRLLLNLFEATKKDTQKLSRNSGAVAKTLERSGERFYRFCVSPSCLSTQEASWISKAFLREVPFSRLTGEDLHLSYMVRKVLGHRAFQLVSPCSCHPSWRHWRLRFVTVFLVYQTVKRLHVSLTKTTFAGVHGGIHDHSYFLHKA